ncbi:MAG TPA: HRDC domain-containing protein, partial [Gemmatimonadaceae bacterium]|nr:HRDC domain-containing protein [Gemmatimonadaceae bacterium]
KPAKRERSKSAAVDVSEPDSVALTQAEIDLLTSLREKRREISRQEEVPAYIVFSDRTLAEMALRRPTTLAAMSKVRGVGEMKLARYGEAFLDVIRNSSETEAA